MSGQLAMRAVPPQPGSTAPAAVADDAALVERAQRGERQAFADLYRRHVRYVAGVLHRLLHRDEDVDDLIQDTFADAYANLGRLRDRSSFRGWVARIAVCSAYDRIARRRRRNWLASMLHLASAPAHNPEERGDVAALYRVLESMPADRRVPWMLHVVEGERLEDVARLCSFSLATAKRRIAEASEHVARCFDA